MHDATSTPSSVHSARVGRSSRRERASNEQLALALASLRLAFHLASFLISYNEFRALLKIASSFYEDKK
jgi:hypothetical protein